MSKQNFLGGSSPVVLESAAPVVVAVSLSLLQKCFQTESST